MIPIYLSKLTVNVKKNILERKVFPASATFGPNVQARLDCLVTRSASFSNVWSQRNQSASASHHHIAYLRTHKFLLTDTQRRDWYNTATSPRYKMTKQRERLKYKLKIECLKGNIPAAVQSASALITGRPTFPKLLLVLFTPLDGYPAGQSPFQYAVDSQNHNMVLAFLSALVVVSQVAEVKVGHVRRLDLASWLEQGDVSAYLSGSDFRRLVGYTSMSSHCSDCQWTGSLCYEKRFTYKQLVTIFDHCGFSEAFRGAGQLASPEKRTKETTAKKQKHPALAVEDDYDTARIDRYYEDLRDPESDEELSYDAKDAGPDTKCFVSSGVIFDVQNGLASEKVAIEEASDEWSCLTADVSTFDWIDKDDVQEEQALDDVSDTWELTSEIGSVLFWGDEPVSSSRKPSYADAVRKFDAPVLRTYEKASTRRPIDKQIPENEPLEDDDRKFDAFFVMEGYKGGRGGKTARHFKGNQKTPSRRKPRKV